MATVNYKLRSKNNPANINIRFSNGRGIDIPSTLGIYINPLHWDSKAQKIKNVIQVTNRNEINDKLFIFKAKVIEQYNLDYANGEIIDKSWLDEVIKKFFNRPKDEVNKVNLAHTIYYFEYADFWLKNKSKNWRTPKNKLLSFRAVQQYESFLKIYKKFEVHANQRYQIKQINNSILYDFVAFMEEYENYEQSTVTRHLGRFRFFLNRAEGENLQVDKSVHEPVFVTEKAEVLEPYHDETEIERIFNFDFSSNQELENIRDNYIIGLWTGLRISDFNNKLNLTNIHNDYIEIQTSKMGNWVTIPLHPMIKAILKKRFGLLPTKVHNNKFNELIKIICKRVGIDNEMRGKLFDAKLKRNVVGTYKKYKLVSSHICRRSFATNLHGIVPNSVIMAAGGWESEEMMLHYIKKSRKEHVEVLRQTWSKQYENKNN